jgi:hypothetical protein
MAAPRQLATFDSLLLEVREIMREAPTGLGLAMAHCAQSIECSIDGYPRRAAWPVRAIIGPLVLRKFLKQGFMRHDTTAPVPGVPAPPSGLSAFEGVAKLEAAIVRFAQHSGPLAPHFAYGPVSKTAYEAVHVMHAANHLDALLV